MAEGAEAAVNGGIGGSGGFAATGLLPSKVAPELRSQAELMALVHLRVAAALWHRQGGGRVATAHRLAAALLFSLISPSSREWRLSPLVRDLIALGEGALPAGLDELAVVVEPLAGECYLSVLDGVAGGRAGAEGRFREVVELARGIAAGVAAFP